MNKAYTLIYIILIAALIVWIKQSLAPQAADESLVPQAADEIMATQQMKIKNSLNNMSKEFLELYELGYFDASVEEQSVNAVDASVEEQPVNAVIVAGPTGMVQPENTLQQNVKLRSEEKRLKFATVLSLDQSIILDLFPKLLLVSKADYVSAPRGNKLNEDELNELIQQIWFSERMALMLTPHTPIDKKNFFLNFSTRGKLKITSVPKDATIKINNDTIQSHTDTTIWPKSGKYRLVIFKKGYESHKQTYNVIALRKGHVDVKLKRMSD